MKTQFPRSDYGPTREQKRVSLFFLVALIAVALAFVLCATGCATPAGLGGPVATHAIAPITQQEINTRNLFWVGTGVKP